MEKIFRGLPHPDNASFLKIVKFSTKNEMLILPLLPTFTTLIATRLSFRAAYSISYYFSGKRIYLARKKSRFEKKINFQIDLDTYENIREIARGEIHIEIPSAWGLFTIIRKVAMMVHLETTNSKASVQITFGSNRRMVDKLWKQNNK